MVCSTNVALRSLRLQRDGRGHLRLARLYDFEFTVTGDQRLRGNLRQGRQRAVVRPSIIEGNPRRRQRQVCCPTRGHNGQFRVHHRRIEATGGAGFPGGSQDVPAPGGLRHGCLTCIVSFDPKNNWGHRFVPVDPQVIRDQMEAAMSSQDLDTVKIGMLGHRHDRRRRRGLKNPELEERCARSRSHLQGQEPGAASTPTMHCAKILPLATVATPNYFEACTLAGMDKLETRLGPRRGRRGASPSSGPRYVVVKGGIDFPGQEAVDVLWDGENATAFSSPKIGEHRVLGRRLHHGRTAITAELAKGTNIHDAVRIAKDVVTDGNRPRSLATPRSIPCSGAPTSRRSPLPRRRAPSSALRPVPRLLRRLVQRQLMLRSPGVRLWLWQRRLLN